MLNQTHSNQMNQTNPNQWNQNNMDQFSQSNTNQWNQSNTNQWSQPPSNTFTQSNQYKQPQPTVIQETIKYPSLEDPQNQRYGFGGLFQQAGGMDNLSKQIGNLNIGKQQ